MKVVFEMRVVEAEGWKVDGNPRWECPHSPSGFCQYNTVKDRALDDCIHCHQPLERK